MMMYQKVFSFSPFIAFLISMSLNSSFSLPPNIPFQNFKINANDSDPGGVEMDRCLNVSAYNSPEIHLKAPGIIRYFGFPVELHKVVTEDGYILTLHRIPSKSNNKLPILLQHGNMGSSVNWIVPSVSSALAYRLSSLGYDVWMGNMRGNSYSLDHTIPGYQHWEEPYWNFSWHEMGIYDTPATIDYILNATGHSRLYYIGHSMGCTVYFVCMSLRPEYNAKVELFFALAPVVYLSNMSFFTLNLLAPFSYSLPHFQSYFGDGMVIPELLRLLLIQSLGATCSRWTAVNCYVCGNIYHMLFNSDGHQTNYTMLPVVKAHFPDSASTKTLAHFLQNAVTGKFQEWDDRLAVPGGPNAKPKFVPKEYPLEKVSSPVIIFHADRDNIANPKDVGKLIEKLPNVKGVVKVCYPFFNHVDFLYGVDVNPLVYDKLLHILGNEGDIDDEKLDVLCKMPFSRRHNLL